MHYQSGKAIDHSFKYSNSMKECLKKKYFFYSDARKLKPETKELMESQKQINLVIIMGSIMKRQLENIN